MKKLRLKGHTILSFLISLTLGSVVLSVGFFMLVVVQKESTEVLKEQRIINNNWKIFNNISKDFKNILNVQKKVESINNNSLKSSWYFKDVRLEVLDKKNNKVQFLNPESSVLIFYNVKNERNSKNYGYLTDNHKIYIDKKNIKKYKKLQGIKFSPVFYYLSFSKKAKLNNNKYKKLSLYRYDFVSSPEEIVTEINKFEFFEKDKYIKVNLIHDYKESNFKNFTFNLVAI